jgi:hypothetical protein
VRQRQRRRQVRDTKTMRQRRPREGLRRYESEIEKAKGGKLRVKYLISP